MSTQPATLGFQRPPWIDDSTFNVQTQSAGVYSLVAPGNGKRWVIVGYHILGDGTAVYQVIDSAGNAVNIPTGRACPVGGCYLPAGLSGPSGPSGPNFSGWIAAVQA